jgi:hypothetical protein
MKKLRQVQACMSIKKPPFLPVNGSHGKVGKTCRDRQFCFQPVSLDTYCPVRVEGPGKFDPLLAEKVQTGNGLMTICYLISNGCDAFVIPAHFLLIADGNTLKTRVIRIKGNCSRDPGGAI